MTFLHRMTRLTRLAVHSTALAAMAAGAPVAAGAGAQPAGAAPTAAAADAMPGITVAIGGALKDDNAAVWQRLVELAGGPGARFAVFATAAGDPDASAARIIASLQRHGAVAEHIRVAPRLPDVDPAAAVRDPAWVARVAASQAVFFSGGAQARIVDTLRPLGVDTPLLQAVRALHRRGGLVAGTSSGAAVMSDPMFRDAPDVLAVLKGQLRDGIEVGPGLGFAPPGLLVDQHFIERGRIGRLLPVMGAHRLTLGVGVAEDTAAVLRDGAIEVVGRGGVLVADLSDAEATGAGPFALRGARLSVLDHGDRFALAARQVLPSAAKRAGTVLHGRQAEAGYFSGSAFYPDLLAGGVLVQAMARLVDSPNREAHGLAFDARPDAADPLPDLGFEWRLYKRDDTLGWAGNPGDDYTLANVGLDVRPVRMARPLYSGWVDPAPPGTATPRSAP